VSEAARSVPMSGGNRGAVVQALLPFAVLLIVGALLWQYLDVYFTFSAVPDEVTARDRARYTVTAGIGVAVAISAVVLALVRRRVLAFVVAVVLATVMIGVAAVFAVPRPDWDPAPIDNGPSNYEPCYSGSNDCVGG